MIVLVALLVAALIVVTALFLGHIDSLEEAWAMERRELLTRIQRPEQLPTLPVENFEFPEPEVDEIDLVGTIAELKGDE